MAVSFIVWLDLSVLRSDNDLNGFNITPSSGNPLYLGVASDLAQSAILRGHKYLGTVMHLHVVDPRSKEAVVTGPSGSDRSAYICGGDAPGCAVNRDVLRLQRSASAKGENRKQVIWNSAHKI